MTKFVVTDRNGEQVSLDAKYVGLSDRGDLQLSNHMPGDPEGGADSSTLIAIFGSGFWISVVQGAEQ